MDSEEPEHNNSDIDKSPKAGIEMRPPKSRFKLALLALAVLLIISSLLIGGILPRLARQKKIDSAALAVQDGIPGVNVITAKQAPAITDLELPGDVEAIQVATISAQTSGYLRRWYVDIGDRVKSGQLLAEIDTPEVDQQLEQARATLVQARAGLAQAEANLHQAVTNLEFARVSFERWDYLAQQHVVPDQDRDQMQAAYRASKATVDAMQANINATKATIAANEANVRRFVYLQGYKKVYAPFAGIITARNVEVGSLINSGSGSNASSSTGATDSGASIPGSNTTQMGTGAPAGGGGLFQTARIDTLRVFISVPQTFVTSIRPGQSTEIAIREFPQQKFTGRVARTANALDPASRTLLTEVQIGNADYRLLPGMYATISLNVTLAEPPVRIPATALVIRDSGPQVVIVTSDQKARFQNVVIGRDYGNELDIVSGLEPGATIVVNIADGVQDGSPVRAQRAQTETQ